MAEFSGESKKEDGPKLVLVDSSVLPSVFIKVLEAKKLVAKGLASNSSTACKTVGISRSAFYKYRGSVFFYDEKYSNMTITLYLRLKDVPGVLSSVLALLCRYKTNVLTVNQNIPINEVADVSITIQINEAMTDFIAIRRDISHLDGVVEIKRV